MLMGPHGGRGLSLIELLVGITILAFALGVMAPSFADWMRNARVRNTAESIQDGLYFARSEAARRNAIVRFQLVSALDSQCELSTTGPWWVVNLGILTSPAGHCGQAVGDSTTPHLLKKAAVTASSNHSTVSANRSLLGFDGLGRLHNLNDTTEITTFVVDVRSSDGSCVNAGGSVQCLRVVVRPAGLISVCDPAHSEASDPLKCPTVSD
jgi:type IV fimbrial biogenesis protein FimT